MVFESGISNYVRTDGRIAWEDGMKIGDGYHLAGHNTLRSPFRELKPPVASVKTSAKVHLTYETMRNQDDITRTLKSSASASVAHMLASLKVSMELLRTAKCNSTTMVTIIRCAITLPTENFDVSLQLTEEAKSKSSCYEDFIQRFGEYCISGWTRQSIFFAICVHTATSSELLDEFQAKLNVGFNGSATGAKLASEFMKKVTATSKHVSIETKIDCLGYNAKRLDKDFKRICLEKAWKYFLKNWSPLPTVAILKHYSALGAEGLDSIPGPNRTHDISTGLVAYMGRALALQMLTLSSSMTCAKKQLPNIESVINQLTALHISDETLDQKSQTLDTTLYKLELEHELLTERQVMLKLLYKELRGPACQKQWRT